MTAQPPAALLTACCRLLLSRLRRCRRKHRDVLEWLLFLNTRDEFTYFYGCKKGRCVLCLPSHRGGRGRPGVSWDCQCQGPLMCQQASSRTDFAAPPSAVSAGEQGSELNCL